MKFGYTIVYVKDVAATIDFYERAFGLTRRFVGDDNQYGEMETGETTLSFASNELAQSHYAIRFHPNDPASAPGGVEIALVTPDVEAAFASAVSAGAAPLAEPERKPWGQVVSYVRDLNGVLIEICSPM